MCILANHNSLIHYRDFARSVIALFSSAIFTLLNLQSNPAKDSTSDRVRITMIAPSTPSIIIVDVLDIVASDIVVGTCALLCIWDVQ